MSYAYNRRKKNRKRARKCKHEMMQQTNSCRICRLPGELIEDLIIKSLKCLAVGFLLLGFSLPAWAEDCSRYMRAAITQQCRIANALEQIAQRLDFTEEDLSKENFEMPKVHWKEAVIEESWNKDEEEVILVDDKGTPQSFDSFGYGNSPKMFTGVPEGWKLIRKKKVKIDCTKSEAINHERCGDEPEK